jgi:HTH-type transcriptional regulator/antitoxin HigA
MTRTLYKHEPDYAVPPGETLKELLEDLEMSQAELAARTGLSTKHVNQVVQGHVSLTPDMAARLEPVLGVPARIWNNLESNYRDQLIRLEDRAASSELSEWLKTLPVNELKKRGVLPDTRDVAALASATRRFFGVASHKAWTDMWSDRAAAFRLSPTFQPEMGALASWVRLTELEALQVDRGPYDRERFLGTLHAIRAATCEPPQDLGSWLQAKCADVGVAIVFVPEVKGARVSGAAFWHGRAKPVIALSLRYRSDDHFWFSLFHEAGHILLHPRSEQFIDDGGSSSAEQEQEADRFAATLLIPESYEQRLPSLRTLAEIKEFAKELGIAPGIVVGRLQHDRVIPFRVGNGLKRRLSFVS